MFRTITTIGQHRASLAVVLIALALWSAACAGAPPASTPFPTLPLAPAPTVQATTAPAPTTAAPTTAPTAAPASPTAVAPTTGPTTAPTTAPVTGATPAPTTGTTQGPAPAPGVSCNFVTFLGDVTLPDNTVVQPGQALTKTWRVRNDGTCAWSGYTLVFVRGDAMTTTTSVPIPETAPGATVDISVPLVAPTTPGTYTGFWDIQVPGGRRFGVQVWATLNVGGGPAAAPTVAPAVGAACNRMTFVTDVTLPDNTLVQPGEALTKTWRVTNSGTCTWSGYTLVFARGQAMGTTTSVAIPETAPGAAVDISVPLVAPTTAGTFTSFWVLQAPDGSRFSSVWATLRIAGAPAAAPTLGPGASLAPQFIPEGVDTQGMQVVGLSLIPPQPGIREPIGFRMTLVNTSSQMQTYRWFVKVYQCTSLPCAVENLKPSIGESTVVESQIQPGTAEVIAPQFWQIGSGICNFVAVPHFLDRIGSGVNPILQSNGIPLYVPFALC